MDTHIDTQYEDLLRRILDEGTLTGNRTEVKAIDLFRGGQLVYDLSNGLPLITTKRVMTKAVIVELLWLISGSTNIRPLLEHNVTIWSEWPFVAYLTRTRQTQPEFNSPEWKSQIKSFNQRVLEDADFAEQYGDLGPVYGKQWRAWTGADGKPIDQLANAIRDIKNNPSSRRIIVNAWNVTDLPYMALTPCHAFFQFGVEGDRLNLHLYQRSADMFLGVPFNILSYSLLLHMVAQQTELQPGVFIWTGGSTHIYENHVDVVHEQLSREPYPFPRLELQRAASIDDYRLEHFKIVGYKYHPALYGEVAV